MHVSFDIVLLAIIVGAFFTIVLYLGKSKVIAGLFSLYLSALLFSVFPYTEELFGFVKSESLKPFIAPLVFVVGWVLTFFVMKNIEVSGSSGGFARKIIESALLSIVSTGAFLSVLYNILSFTQFYSFGEPVKSLFIFTGSLFWWLLGGLVVSFFLVRR